MPEAILSDYFYGDEAEQFQFFRIPRQLITNPKFKHLSTEGKQRRKKRRENKLGNGRKCYKNMI